MIQAPDLERMLYGDHPSWKYRGPRKISIGPPFYRWPPWAILKFALRWQQMIEKDYFDKLCILSIHDVQLIWNYSNVWIVLKWPHISKTAAIAYHVILFCLKTAADGSKDGLGRYVIYFSMQKVSLMIQCYLSVQIISAKLPNGRQGVYVKMLSFALKMKTGGCQNINLW